MLNIYQEPGNGSNQTPFTQNQNVSKNYTSTTQGNLDNYIIANNERYFKFFVVLPKIMTIFFAVVCFILGIIFAVEDGALGILVFWLGGAIFCVLTYFCLKIVLSRDILQTYYLKKISNNIEMLNSNIKKTSESKDELPII